MHHFPSTLMHTAIYFTSIQYGKFFNFTLLTILYCLQMKTGRLMEVYTSNYMECFYFFHQDFVYYTY